MIFIDAEYVIQSLRHLMGQGRVGLDEIRWRELIEWITGNRYLVRCYYYSALLSKEENPQTHQQQQIFFDKLKTEVAYLEIREGKLVKQKGGWVQKGVDVKLAVDMVTKAFLNHYDIGAIVSGDSDFVSLIRDIKEGYGKQIELYTFDRTDSRLDRDLVLTADRHVHITSAMYNQWGPPTFAS